VSDLRSTSGSDRSPHLSAGVWHSVSDRWALLGIVTVGVGLPALLGAASGALFVSHNDDFNYRRVALGLYETGQIQLTGWTVQSLIGQLLFVQPFLWLSSGEAWAFAVATAVLAVVALAASYYLVRRLLPVRWALFALGTTLFFPGFLLNTTSFMTDVPALAGEMLCLALGAAALERRGRPRWGWLAASLAAGCFAFSIRQFALAAPVAVLVAAAASEGGRRFAWRPYGLAALALASTCAAISFATANLPGQGTATVAFFSPDNVSHTRKAIATLALVLSPAFVVAGASWRTNFKVRDLVAGAVVGGVLFVDEIRQVLQLSGAPNVFVGNLLVAEGAPGSGAMAGDRPALFPSPTWEILNVAALIAAIGGFALFGAVLGAIWRKDAPITRQRLRRWLGSTAGLLAVFAILFGAGLLAFGLAASMFDRYLWPLALPITALLLLRPASAQGWGANHPTPGRLALGLTGILLASLAVTSLVLLLNSDAFDAARWQMGDDAVNRGIPPETVDAGMEWVGYHASGQAVVDAPATVTEMWYDAWWPSFHLCAIVSSSYLDLPGFRLEEANTEAYRLLLLAGPEEGLYLYRVSNPGCP
jgi:4-amino-4-deoxy-L-arabinose transferase-like glycosyltransferase